MVDPATFDITIHQGATFSLDLQYKDSAGTGVNMSGYDITSKIISRTGGTDIATFTTTFTDQAVGKFNMKLTAATTQGITSEGLYDVLITEPGGDKFYLLQGRTKLDTGISGMP
jgi:hypothetical protein